MKKSIALFTGALMLCAPLSGLTSGSRAAAYPSYYYEGLWDNFLRYDLCITDYDSLTEEQQELCHFIFDTETSHNDDIVCERARRILAGDDVGERLTLQQLGNAYGIADQMSYYKTNSWLTYINCVPDVVHLELGDLRNNIVDQTIEYWLDDERNSYVVYRMQTSPDTKGCFEVYNKKDELIETIPTVFDCPMRDFRGDAEYMEKFGFIEKNGGYYYKKSDGTAVLAWTNYTYTYSDIPITKPFTVEREIDGCPVTAIEKNAFTQTPFTEIRLPDTIEIIDSGAFAECKYLKSINFPSTLKYMGVFSFIDCLSLTEITVLCPELNIQKWAFSNCTRLKTAQLLVSEIGENAFDSCTSLEKIDLMNGIKRIDSQAFKNVPLLNELTIPRSVKAIEQDAFQSSITSVTIPPEVEVIGAYPHKTFQDFTSGIEPPPPRRPLTDEPKCAFDSSCVIKGCKGTEAERYANEWGLEFVPLDYIKGDANFDGTISIADVVTVQSYLLNKHGSKLNCYEAADFTEDGIIDVFDLRSLRSSLVSKLNSRSIEIFGLTPSDNGVEEFLKTAVIPKYISEKEDCFNVTPEEITEKYGFRVFKFESSCESFLVYNGEMYVLGMGFGGNGTETFAAADINGDGAEELYFTFSCGSGLHHSSVGYFDTATKETGGFDFSSLMDDLTFDLRDGRLELCKAKLNVRSFVDIKATPEEKLGEIVCENGSIVLKTVDAPQ